MKTAMITGITGQDGAYLSKFLLGKGYQVIGLVRSYKYSGHHNLSYLGINNEVILEECDLLDISRIMNIINKYDPDEIYNLAAQSSVKTSFDQPIGTMQFNIISILNILESIKTINPKIKFYQASSSEMFGKAENLPIVEKTVIHPLSPYAISKAAAHWTTINYREAYNLFTCCGILFNHESYLRNERFFVKKVIRQAIDIHKGKQEVLKVGNIDVKRDFGFSPKYIEAMWLMLQQDKPDDFIICSGKSISLKEIVYYVFDKLSIRKDKIIIDKNLYRPADIIDMYGDNSKAKEILNWNYDLDFFNILDILIDEELRNYQ
ncbi:MAG: hypothetical protein ACD_20C00434G0004 [uncultured bacterium]|nr:MAG: hypothetical protein ACD_20C00434G0004 [uncultured bacterium]